MHTLMQAHREELSAKAKALGIRDPGETEEYIRRSAVARLQMYRFGLASHELRLTHELMPIIAEAASSAASASAFRHGMLAILDGAGQMPAGEAIEGLPSPKTARELYPTLFTLTEHPDVIKRIDQVLPLIVVRFIYMSLQHEYLNLLPGVEPRRAPASAIDSRVARELLIQATGKVNKEAARNFDLFAPYLVPLFEILRMEELELRQAGERSRSLLAACVESDFVPRHFREELIAADAFDSQFADSRMPLALRLYVEKIAEYYSITL